MMISLSNDKIGFSVQKTSFNFLLHEDKVFQHNIDDEIQYDVTVTWNCKKKKRKNLLLIRFYYIS